MKVGDLVFVSSPDSSEDLIGIILAEQKYPLVGYIVQTLVMGELREVLREEVTAILPEIEKTE